MQHASSEVKQALLNLFYELFFPQQPESKMLSKRFPKTAEIMKSLLPDSMRLCVAHSSGFDYEFRLSLVDIISALNAEGMENETKKTEITDDPNINDSIKQSISLPTAISNKAVHTALDNNSLTPDKNANDSITQIRQIQRVLTASSSHLEAAESQSAGENGERKKVLSNKLKDALKTRAATTIKLLYESLHKGTVSDFFGIFKGRLRKRIDLHEARRSNGSMHHTSTY